MPTVTVPKKEYEKLVETKLRYERLREAMEEDLFSPPPTQDAKKTLSAFRGTKKYNQKFLGSLKKGLGRSSYFRL